MSEPNKPEEWSKTTLEVLDAVEEEYDDHDTCGHTIECVITSELLRGKVEKLIQEQKHSILSTLKSEVEKIKLPVPNPYGKWVKVENVNKILQQVINLIEKHQK